MQTDYRVAGGAAPVRHKALGPTLVKGTVAVLVIWAMLIGALMLRSKASANATGTHPKGAAPSLPADTFAKNPIPAENARAGTKDWILTGRSDRQIAGFAAPISARQGEPVKLFVSTNAPKYDVSIYRMGWYAGAGGRLVFARTGLSGVQQAPPTTTKPIENMVETQWHPTLTVTPTTAWTSGVYLAKLHSSLGSESYIPFIVRDDRASRLLFQTSVTTWQAYNVWGGRSLYKVTEGPDAGNRDARSREVSFDRPFNRADPKPTDERKENTSKLRGAEEFLLIEVQTLRFVEKQGYDVTYSSNIETHTSPTLLLQHNGILSVGHDEYWSKQMRDNLELAVARGVNIAFLTANAGFRGIRFASSPNGPNRRMVHYKEYTEDPLLGTKDDIVASQWRWGPANRPENSLIGQMYVCDPVDAAWTVGDTSSWLFEGTGFQAGDNLPHVVGHEYDRAYLTGPFAAFTPKNLQIIARSPVECAGKKDTSTTTMYTAPSGAGVFAAGTIRWGWGLDSFGGHKADARFQHLTKNLLNAFSAGPLNR